MDDVRRGQEVKTTEELERELKDATGEYNCAIANGLVLKARPIGRRIAVLERALERRLEK
jgi:hypothetical protein